jgi:MurNAc alpha-1-phosphate uridylyltransferase
VVTDLLPVAILAGGLATRLRPITERIPKALIEVAGRPFVFHQLENLHGQGVTRVVLCTGYLGEQIESVVGNGSSFGLDVRYSPDGPTLLGTGGALRKAQPLLGEQFFVLYGDSFLPCSFREAQEAFVASGQPALMTVLHNSGRWDQSNVQFSGGQILEHNKRAPNARMEHIDYGLGVLSAHVLNGYPPDQPFDLAEVYQQLSVDQRLAGHEVHQRFYEIGSHEGLKETEAYLSNKEKT